MTPTPKRWIDLDAATRVECAAQTVIDVAQLLENLARHDTEVEFQPGGLSVLAIALHGAVREMQQAVGGEVPQ